MAHSFAMGRVSLLNTGVGISWFCMDFHCKCKLQQSCQQGCFSRHKTANVTANFRVGKGSEANDVKATSETEVACWLLVATLRLFQLSACSRLNDINKTGNRTHDLGESRAHGVTVTPKMVKEALYSVCLLPTEAGTIPGGNSGNCWRCCCM